MINVGYQQYPCCRKRREAARGSSLGLQPQDAGGACRRAESARERSECPWTLPRPSRAVRLAPATNVGLKPDATSLRLFEARTGLDLPCRFNMSIVDTQYDELTVVPWVIDYSVLDIGY